MGRRPSSTSLEGFSKARTAFTLIGVAVGMVIAGLIVPFVVGDPVETRVSTGASDPASSSASDGGSVAGLSASQVDRAPAGASTDGVRSSGAAAPAAAVANPRTPAASTPSPTNGPLTATDVGVTADAIKLGVVLADLGGASRLVGGLAGASADEQQAALQAFINEANRQGGVTGRKLVPVYTRWDPVAGDAAVNCNQLTQDDKVFAVLSQGMYGAPVLCVTEQHRTPLLNNGGYIDDYYARSNGLLFTFQPSKPRSARSAAFELHRQGVLKDKTIGVFTSKAGDDNIAVTTGLVPALQELGYKVAHITTLNAEPESAASQVPIEVNRMQAAGVNLVFLHTNVVFDTQFAQQADGQGYRPLYALSDSESNVSDFFLSNMPASFRAIGITANRIGEQRIALPEAPGDADCRSVVEKATGASPARGSAGYEVAMSACNQVRMFVSGARAAGARLTRASFSAGMQGLGAFAQAYSAGGSFGPGKFDAADFARSARADMTCRCWMPVGEFQPMTTRRSTT